MVITIQKLTDLLLKKEPHFAESETGEKDARKIAECVLDAFGYSTCISDMTLRSFPQEDNIRNLFYMLEEDDILETKWEEILLPPPRKNRQWRIHYWLFREDYNQAKPKLIEAPKLPECEPEAKCYLNGNVPEEAWKHRTAVEV